MHKLRVALSSCLLAGGMAASADVYTIDPIHSTVAFSIRHMMVSNVKGVFNDFEGAIEFDPADLAKCKASGAIKVASINTGNADRDHHLRTPDFFDAQKYPEINFVTEKVEKRGDLYMVTGKFTMHGVIREITLPVTVSGPIVDPMGNTRLGIETTITINRQDYGIKYNTLLDNGGLAVGNEVKCELNIEAIKKPAE